MSQVRIGIRPASPVGLPGPDRQVAVRPWPPAFAVPHDDVTAAELTTPRLPLYILPGDGCACGGLYFGLWG